MKLLRKTLLIIGVTVIVLIGILYVASELIMSSGVAQQENRIAAQNVERLLDAFSHEISELDKTAFDWAAWDDTYAFVQNVDPKYISSNLADATFKNLRLNFMLFVNSSGQMVYGRAFDLLNETEIAVSQSLLEHLATHEQLLDHESTESSVSGTIRLPEAIVIVASRPILTSELEGPIRGTLIMGRFFDSTELNSILERVHLPITLQILGDAQMSFDFLNANMSLSKEKPVFIQPLSNEIISGYTLIEDVYGNSILIFRVDMARDLYAQGVISAFYVNALLVIVGLTYAILMAWLLEKFVLSRLSKLTKDVKRIGESGNFDARVSTTGKDELTGLTDQINEMLSALDKAKESLSVSETRLRQITENMFDMVSLTDAKGVYQYVSPSVRRTLGYEPQELLGKSIFDFLHPDDTSRVAEAVQKAIETKTSGNMEYRYKRKDGQYLWLEGAGNLLLDDKGQVVGAVLSSHDITERKKMEEQLRESEERFRGIAERSFDAIAIVDNKGTITFASPSVGKVLGYPQSEVLGKSFLEYFPSVALSDATQLFADLMQGKSFEGLQVELPKRDGTTAIVEVNVSPVIMNDEVTGVQAVFRDITERKKTEQALRDSEEKYRLLFENVNDVVFSYDHEFKILSMSPSVMKSLGYKPEELVGKKFQELNIISPESLETAMNNALRVFKGEQIKPSIYEFVKIDGTKGFGEITSSPLIREGKVMGVIAVARDITERLKMQEALKESEERFRKMFETASDSLIYLDESGKIVNVNESAVQVFGGSKEELLGKHFTEITIFSPNDRPALLEAFVRTVAGNEGYLNIWIKNRKGQDRYLECLSSITKVDDKFVGILISARDATERKRMEEVIQESEEKLRNILESSPDAITVSDLDGNIIDCNQATLEMRGVTRKEEVIGRNVIEFIAEKDREKAIENIKKTILEGSIKNIEYTLVNEDKREFPAEISASVVKDASGKPKYFVGIIKDITERKKGEKAILESKQKFERLFKSNPDASVYVDANDRFLDANPRFVELFGYSVEEARGRALDDLIVSENEKKEARDLTQKSMEGYIYHETTRKKKDGSIIPVSMSAAPIYVDNQFAGCVVSYRDITERKHMEAKLRHTTKRLQTLLETAREGITIANPQENLTFANKAFGEIVGYEETELLGINTATFLDEEGKKKVADETELRKEGTTSRYELTMYRKNGEPRIVQLSASPLWNEDGSYAGSLGIVIDITERKQMEEALRESEEKIRNILQSSPDAILVSDLNGNVIECNQATLSMFGIAERDEVIGKNAIEFIAEKDKQKLPEDMVKGIKQDVNKNLEYILRDVNGREFPAEVSTSVVRDAMGNPLFFVVILEDVTERKQMQQKLQEYSQQLEVLVEKRTKQLQEAHEQLVKSERLAAIGQVAAMVGHDLRNPLTGIKGATYYLKTKSMMKKDKKAEEMLELIEKDIEYSNKIITDLLEYSREIHLELTETTPQLIIEETLPLLETPNNIQIVDLTENEPKIMVDIEKLNRVFVNLIKNAFDAMPNGGKLTIASTKTNGNTEFSFTDTGIGILKEHIAKLWTPFFTTKAKGMGLGLPICKRIVEAHRGHISVQSTVASGTTFTVTIPMEQKTKEEGGEKVWINVQESLLSTTTKASEKS